MDSSRTHQTPIQNKTSSNLSSTISLKRRRSPSPWGPPEPLTLSEALKRTGHFSPERAKAPFKPKCLKQQHKVETPLQEWDQLGSITDNMYATDHKGDGKYRKREPDKPYLNTWNECGLRHGHNAFNISKFAVGPSNAGNGGKGIEREYELWTGTWKDEWVLK
ncbi:hypothetical protein M501DRAFT_1019662 [Patellaria atrata CBS 101060]|uniref:Uncharacterized protein n=1 Tax=Patellaria atrata CBS 101060 TaxID=1346257 RepID=A0A9P4S5Q5_9PEZI|nr:hypothetical protein M501DRAFT_1019662 [Patellaria atrata CBS 101060]